MKQLIVINLLAAPGAGKSTNAAKLFARLKEKSIDVELVTEYAKDLVWEGRSKALDNQLQILGKQFGRLQKLVGEVAVAITDSPLLLQGLYCPPYLEREAYETILQNATEYEGRFRNINYFVERGQRPYNPKGRLQTYAEALALDTKLKEEMTASGVSFKVFDIEEVEKEIIKLLEANECMTM